ncbi:hypothetical protein H6F78_11645 [Coleofasciculus sp. FACHB-64]|uniref:hypothetical protein n=1 Tax=Cyanophyceae TaxID=3028117 RepID=UPI00168520C9|nr:hypothetical protein [Coleofasciculus sp. FACHB-64]MBD1838069.1 hypothetical protein [Coleofasciculus sp. FACHB-501]MBD2046237.1 hypothetical protein [Coleofasciculus sp. FACHB-64]
MQKRTKSLKSHHLVQSSSELHKMPALTLVSYITVTRSHDRYLWLGLLATAL